MKGNLLINERHVLDVGAFVEIVVWRLPQSVRGSEHRFKYRLALVVDGVCVLRFDNEAGKGDHKHVTYAGVRPWRLLGLAGIEFIDENGGGPGVRLRKQSQGKHRK